MQQLSDVSLDLVACPDSLPPEFCRVGKSSRCDKILSGTPELRGEDSKEGQACKYSRTRDLKWSLILLKGSPLDGREVYRLAQTRVCLQSLGKQEATLKIQGSCS